MERKYVAFISYRHAELDSAVAKQLHTLIEQYVIPKNLRKDGKKLGIVFRDEEELVTSSNLTDEICRALDNSQYLIVVCSKNTAQSPWVSREIAHFLSKHDQEHTLAVLASGEPADVFPRLLTQRTLSNGTVEEVEPLAVDVRAKDIPGVKKKLKQEIKRLFAALIGCPYDALVMREQKRKRRQLATVMGLILAVVTSFAGVMLVKNYEIDLKNQELASMNQNLEDANLALENKNDELARQKAQVQLRESQLLTEKGVSFLADSKVQNAMENFISALPASAGDRPYYAPAEQGLIQSMGLFQENGAQYIPTGKEFTQKTTVSVYAISPDGTKLMTVDLFGLVTCYDISGGQVLWTCAADTWEGTQIESIAAANLALVNTRYSITALNWNTGETVWSRQVSISDSMYLTDDQSMLLAHDTEGIQDDAGVQVRRNLITCLDPVTGQLLQQYETGLSDYYNDQGNGYDYWSLSNQRPGTCSNGAFSPDGRYFACHYSVTGDTQEESWRLFVILDLQTGQLSRLPGQKVGRYDLTDLYSLSFVNDGLALLAVCDGTYPEDVSAQLLDAATGKVQWITGISFNRNSDIRDLIVAVRGKRLYVTLGSSMQLHSLETGELLHQKELPAKAVSMEFVNEGCFSLILENGYYCFGWSNQVGIILDADTAVMLPPAKGACLWNKGAMHIIVEDGYIKGIRGGLENGCGYVALLSGENDQCVVVAQLNPIPDLLGMQQLNLMSEGEYLSGNTVEVLDGNRLCLGYIQNRDSGQYFYRFLDLKNQQVREEELPSQGYTYRRANLLSDGSGYLECGNDLVFYRADAQEPVTLMENVTEEFKGMPGFAYSRYLLACQRQNRDGSILTAALGGQQLRLWRDTQSVAMVDIPQNIQAQVVTDVQQFHYLKIGANGLVILADFQQADAGYAPAGLAAYDTVNGGWYRFGQGLDYSSSFTIGAKEHLWVLVLDAADQVHVFDLAADKEIYTFPMQLSASALDFMELICQDRYLLARTGDDQILVYDLETGEICFRDKKENYGDGLRSQVDESRRRLYLWAPQSEGMCIDMDSWTKLADIPGMMHYDPVENVAYCLRTLPDSYQKDLFAFEMPNTAQLIQMAQQLLS